MKIKFIINLVLCLFLWPGPVSAEDWPRFRGPNAAGVAPDHAGLPITWSTTENVKWVADVPGLGWACPVVWGDRVFLTTVVNDHPAAIPEKGMYLGEGVRDPAKGVHRWLVCCFDLNTGDVLWKHEAHVGQPQVPRHPKSTYASETPTTDGERLYVLFGDLGLWCYDLNGTVLWNQKIEPEKAEYDYGAAASPVVHDGQVIVVYDNLESSWIPGFDAEGDDLSISAIPNAMVLYNPGVNPSLSGRSVVRSKKGTDITKAIPPLENSTNDALLRQRRCRAGAGRRVCRQGERARPRCRTLAGRRSASRLLQRQAFREADAPHSPYPGARGAPTIDGDMIYLLGGLGRLTAYHSSDGESMWSVDIVKDLGGRVPPWGYTESVLIDGDKLICTPGSETNGTFAALDKKTGQLLWQSREITARAEYGSPILIEFEGVRQVVTMSRAGLVAVSPEDGKFLWQHNRMAKKALAESLTAHGNLAAYADGYVFEATSYQTRGGSAVRLKSNGAGVTSELAWESDKLNCEHGGYVIVDGHIYMNQGVG